MWLSRVRPVINESNPVITVWFLCKSGCHRSVALADMSWRYSSRPATVFHLGSATSWSKYCGGCDTCLRPWDEEDCRFQMDLAAKCGVNLHV